MIEREKFSLKLIRLYKGKSGLSKGSGSSKKAYPEEISSEVMGMKINGNVIITKSGKEISVSSIQEITDKKLLERAHKAGLEDPVSAGPYIVARAVAETAIAQKALQDKNYELNIEKNVKGLNELYKAIADREIEYRKQKKSIEKGEIIYKAAPSNVAALKKKYPRAASYLIADGYANSSDYVKSSLGREAQKAIRMGENHKEVIARMEKKWKEYLDSRY